jgi:hypothetical protein
LTILSENPGAGGSSFFQHRPQELLDGNIEQFFASLRFENKGKLDDLEL